MTLYAVVYENGTRRMVVARTFDEAVHLTSRDGVQTSSVAAVASGEYLVLSPALLEAREQAVAH